MITQEQIPMVIDHPLYDVDGEKVGEVKHVYLDDATGKPEWLCVRTGLFGMKETFVPVQSSNLVEDHVEAGYDKSRIKNAPNVDVDDGGHLSADEERELYRYYEIAWEGAWARANEPGEGGWAHSGGQREREVREGRGDDLMGRPGGAETSRGGTTAGQDDAMTRSEEHLRVGKESHETGRARLRKYVVTEEEQVTIPTTHEEARLEREPITDANRDAALNGPEITDAEHEVILHEERPVVDTETVPVERVRLTKEQVSEEETVSGQVRKERIETEGDVGDPDRGR
ncbi:PRC and DUF2382 domain-containing protein [Streptosporangium sp. NBC_01756]|uniref:PRC and DUF2382 domain-containing protein n=1 Tax=Streptosporangium sp. NBC_01756 TaxID=2975950 RepID=UPI002DD7D25D|nr:PRC and DUF2382 domain-containing protein [Streptosporangium sp. NBC_01756]WSC89348.1 PRC and DUF2382 domain-containing protein [Streptosporangium sp. NBC_01756]